MDTKWNSTDQPSGIESVSLKEGTPRRWRAKAGFLAFVLGASLTVSSLGNAGNRIAWERDLVPRFTRDWQETENFRSEVSSCLRDFLTIGAGGKLGLYDYSYWTEHGEEVYDEAVIQAVEGGGWRRPATYLQQAASDRIDRGTASSTSAPAVPEPEEGPKPDAAYRSDKNVLYFIRNDKSEEHILYSNAEDEGDKLLARSVDGYNFYLQFVNGKVSILKDGQILDVYGDGIYDGDSQWFVPGYYNFPATDQLDGVKVVMAVRKTPVRSYAVDYKTGNSYNNSSMYYLAQRVEETQRFYRVQLALFIFGLVWLNVWFFLRKHTAPVNRKIASWTVHVWTEARFVLALLCLAWAFLPALSNTDIFWAWRYGYFWEYAGSSFSNILFQFLRVLTVNVPGLLALACLIWLIHNDHKYNPKEARRSLLRPFLRGLRARDLKRPVEKRLSRRAALFALAMLLPGAETLYFLITLTTMIGYDMIWVLWTIFLLPLLLEVWAALALARRELGLAKDLGHLADQVEAVRAGDLNRPLVLPEDADLRQTADSLNDIQAGMKAALEEQTRSERMKVELVSNVSHDLKTPLTSILSYAELLRQEDLPPAAMDYARIIDEKARRLKGMVEDVFEVSKAAADQLPVHLERLDLGKLLRQTLADMDGPIQKSALTFKTDLPEAPVMIIADGKRLYRVFQNLIDNALRYALEGSRVYLSLKTAEGLAEASVRNISRGELPEGVDFTARFVRGDSSRTDGGSGLGLSIASSFTEACGGTFRVETVADLFTAIVSFPIAE